jgi:DNA-directed RNA polymerase subunit beta'
LTCEAAGGVCRLCFGVDPATGELVEAGAAVGVRAATALGAGVGEFGPPGTFFINSLARREILESDTKSRRSGQVQYENIRVVANEKGERVALTRKGELHVIGPRGVLETWPILPGAFLHVADGQHVTANTLLCTHDPGYVPIVAERTGRIRFEDMIEGQTLRKERDAGSGAERWVIREHRGDLHPHIVIEDECGQSQELHYIPEEAQIVVREGQLVSPGTLLARSRRYVEGTQCRIGGSSSVREILEARHPRNAAVLAERSGVVRWGEKRGGRQPIYVQPVDEQGRPDDREHEHLLPRGKHACVYPGYHVKAGQPLSWGQPAARDILRIAGVEALWSHLLREVQAIYCGQRVAVDDRHVEVVLARITRFVRVCLAGDTPLLPGTLIDKFAFRAINLRLLECVKVTDPGEARFTASQVVARETFETVQAALTAAGKRPPVGERAWPAACYMDLVGVRQAAAHRAEAERPAWPLGARRDWLSTARRPEGLVAEVVRLRTPRSLTTSATKWRKW